MPHYLEVLLAILSQFTGSHGGILNFVLFGISGMAWGLLLLVAWTKHRDEPTARESLLIWGFGFALSREIFMATLGLAQQLGFVNEVLLHEIFPPFEHTLQDISYLLIAGAFVRYILNDTALAKRLLKAGIAVTLLCYLATFYWWAQFIKAHPSAKFGQVWPDWLFHINGSFWLALTAIILWRRARGWMRNSMCLAFLLFFISAFLKIPDMALHEAYETVFAPLGRLAYLLAIPILGYVYFRELAQERKTAFNQVKVLNTDLEQRVQQRTQNLANEVAAHQQSEEALFAEKERALITLQSIGDAVITTDRLGNIVYLNPVAERLTGWECNQAVNRPATEVFHLVNENTHEAALDPVALVLKTGQVAGLASNTLLVTRQGKELSIEDSAAPIHDRAGVMTGVIVVFHDVNEAHKMAQKMTHQAQHDFLTGLPNRLLLHDRIGQAILHAERFKNQFALMFLDLDNFKHINDTFGHAVGDKLLQQVTARLKDCVRASDTLCRHGGDEFIVLLPNIDGRDGVERTAAKVLSLVTEPYEIDAQHLNTSFSIGISIYPDHGNDITALTNRADAAMYQAKSTGGNNFEFFSFGMAAKVNERLTLESKLRRALERREFVLHYQPKISLATGKLTGVEALIRWQDPDDGLIPPAIFIDIAEDTGLIMPIGNWVLEEACRQNKAWQQAGFTPVPVAVNISALQFGRKNFLTTLLQTLAHSELDPQYLELELTESVLMKDQNAEMNVAIMQSLKKLGVQISIDDFGTGYSSLSYLRRFPISTLKIDRSFVRDVTTNPNDASIVSAIIRMAHSLHVKVIAEGVETEQQMAYLTAHQCDEAQGFYFGKPMSADEMIEVFRKQTSLAGSV